MLSGAEVTKRLSWALTLGTTNKASHTLLQAHLYRPHRPQNPSPQPSNLYSQHSQLRRIPRAAGGQAHSLEPPPPAGAFGAARETGRRWWGEVPEASLRRGLQAWFRSPGVGTLRSWGLGPLSAPASEQNWVGAGQVGGPYPQGPLCPSLDRSFLRTQGVLPGSEGCGRVWYILSFLEGL